MLACRLGYMVEELEERMSFAELCEWAEFYAIRPTDVSGAIQAASISQMMHCSFAKRKGDVKSLDKYIPGIRQRQTEDEQKAQAQMLVAQMGAAMQQRQRGK